MLRSHHSTLTLLLAVTATGLLTPATAPAEGVQQVMLKVHVSELSRTADRTSGFDFVGTGFGGGLMYNRLLAQSGSDRVWGTAGLETLQFNGIGGQLEGPTRFFTIDNIDLLLAALGGRVERVLAEPNLVTLSGQPAQFLAGGEFRALVGHASADISPLNNNQVDLSQPVVSAREASSSAVAAGFDANFLVKLVDTGNGLTVEVHAGYQFLSTSVGTGNQGSAGSWTSGILGGLTW